MIEILTLVPGHNFESACNTTKHDESKRVIIKCSVHFTYYHFVQMFSFLFLISTFMLYYMKHKTHEKV